MPPPSDGDLVSPELALVDPELAACARAVLPIPSAGWSRPAEPPREVAATASARSARRFATPVLTLLATAAASLIVTSFSGPEQANGEAPSANSGSPTAATSATASTPAIAGTTDSAQPAQVSDPATSSTGQRVDSTVATAASSAETSSAVRPAVTQAHRAVSTMTLVWPRSTNTTWYDFELVRSGSVIFSTRSRSRKALVPRSWHRQGVAYTLRPEDRAFVWPVVDGRRASTPVVNGALALDMTLVARFVDSSTTTAHP